MEWNSKHNKRKQQVELTTHKHMASVSIVVGLDGYDWKHYKRDSDRWGQSTRGLNVHLSMNGPLQMSFEQFEEFLSEARAAVENAEDILTKEEK